MYYVKQKIGAAEINIEITYENTYTRCPKCGVEHQIGLDEVIDTIDELDLFGSVYCEECSKKLRKENE